jgi:NADH dehydrogenase FAD-containing subunit
VSRNIGRLDTGSRVAVVGGGPAGIFFALHLLKYARERDILPEVTIYERRGMDQPGSEGCKGCAGILSASLLTNLGDLDLSVPEEIIRNRIGRYTVHSPFTSISINKPREAAETLSVYRGSGPRISDYGRSIGFDSWLLRQAQERGAKVENQLVSCVHVGHEVIVEVAGEKLVYDFIVLASGVNAKPVPIEGVKYVPPKMRMMAQGELYVGADEVESRLGSSAHVFLIPHSGVIFGTLVPKGPFINVSVLSSGDVPLSVRDFLSHSIVRDMLPHKYEYACGCRPWATVGPARGYYADRFVAVGDAALSRLYKDGIGSSLLAAREAARTAAYHGLSRRDFERHYRPFCNALHRDNRWGAILFSINDRAKNSRTFLISQHRLVGNEQDNMAGPQPFTKVIWGMFTGSYSYGNMARMALSPGSLAKLVWTFFKELFRPLFGKKVDYPKKLHIGGKKVLILGSGFGGTYTMRNIVRRLNRNENVETTMVSNENFFLFSPLLHEVAMGRIETRHIAYPIRRLHWRDRFDFIQADILNIDLPNHKVMTTKGTLEFDYLVLALGSETDMSGLGLKESNVFLLKTLHDAMLIRNHIISVFERASVEKNPELQRQLLTFIVSGGGYTGVQLVSELRDFILRGLTRFYKTVNTDGVRIILIEAGRKIVAELHTKLGAYAMEQLRHMGIEVRVR